MVGSATKPSMIDTSVTPSCAPDRWKDSARDIASARLARRLPGLRQRFEPAALDRDQGELGRDEERRAEHE